MFLLRKYFPPNAANKKPPHFEGVFYVPLGTHKESDDDLLSQANAYYHWRGSVSPSCSGWEGVVPLCYGRQTKGWGSGFEVLSPHSDCLGCRSSCDVRPTELEEGVGLLLYRAHTRCSASSHFELMQRASQNYRIKPHGQLVLVSLTHYCASTPSLSTSWSSTTLQGTQGARDILSSGKFHA